MRRPPRSTPFPYPAPFRSSSLHGAHSTNSSAPAPPTCIAAQCSAADAPVQSVTAAAPAAQALFLQPVHLHLQLPDLLVELLHQVLLLPLPPAGRAALEAIR